MYALRLAGALGILRDLSGKIPASIGKRIPT
jgi:hypothetical protein